MSESLPLGLTQRECDVVAAAIEVGPRKLIADKLGISERTVDSHIGSAIRKAGVINIVQLAVKYDRTVRQWSAN